VTIRLASIPRIAPVESGWYGGSAMVWIIGAGVGSAVVTLTCPHCRKDQLRARSPRDHVFTCVYCSGRFRYSREHGEVALPPPDPD
jgi:hypothetical protein